MTLGQSDFQSGQVALSLINLFKPKPVLVQFEYVHVTGSMEAGLKSLTGCFKKMYPISKLNFYQPITSCQLLLFRMIYLIQYFTE